VPGRGQVFFDQHAGILEAGRGFALTTRQRVMEILGAVHAAHALATAPRHGLDEYRKADGARLRE
jgi:hypothetical protein